MKLSNIRKKLKEIYLDVYFKLKPFEYKKGNKILLTVTDGLGDNIVREKLLRKFLEEYGNDRVIIMCVEKTKSFLEKLGFNNIIVYSSNHRKRIKGKIELINKIASLGIEKIVSLEFDQHDIYVKYIKNIEKIGYSNKFNLKYNKYYNKIINFEREDYILEQVKNFYNEYFNENLTLDEILPDISNMYGKLEKYKDIISFGIGSADRKRILCPNKIVEILENLNKIFKGKIILLGKGELEEKLVNEIKTKVELEKYNVVDLVNKISLSETLEIINSSKYYFGMESGLYNFAFGFRKRIFVFFGQKNSFSHDKFENVRIIYGKNENGEDNYFGTRLLNSIEIDYEDLKKILMRKNDE